MGQDARPAVHLCQEIEEACAEIYTFYAEVFSDRPKVRDLWKRTAAEEKDHAKLLQSSLACEALQWCAGSYDLHKFRDGRYLAQTMSEHIRKRKPKILEALSTAIQLEKTLEDIHLECAALFKGMAEENLFESLVKAERDHIAALEHAYRSILCTGEFQVAATARGEVE